MPKARTHGATPRSKKRSAHAPTRRTAKRACGLIERMLKEMELGFENPDYRMSEEWERLFGAKQSMVVNLQKLVAALAVLPLEEKARMPMEKEMEIQPITSEEMALLKAWVAEESSEGR